MATPFNQPVEGRPSTPKTFTDDDFRKITSLSLDPLVVTMIVANKHVRRIMIDIRSFTDILFYDAFNRMGLSESQLTPRKSRLSGFGGASVTSTGTIDLPVTMGDPAFRHVT